MKKSLLVAGGAVGFVLGSRAGRGPYNKIEAQVKKVAGRSDVQKVVGHVQDKVQHAAADTSDKVSHAVDSAKDTVTQAVDTVKSTASDKGDALKGAVKEQAGHAADKVTNLGTRGGSDDEPTIASPAISGEVVDIRVAGPESAE